MYRVCVVTSKGRAYYAIVSRLRRAGLTFTSLLPDSDCRSCVFILTTADELGHFGRNALAIEDLDENPGIFKGQVVSRLSERDEIVLVGVDPGKRMGLAVFYGETRLAFNSFDSVTALCSRIESFARGLPSRRVVVRVGNGSPGIAARLVEAVQRQVPRATVELVDESGTSARSARMRGLQSDQGAAAKIAFRRGAVVLPSSTRIRG